MSNSRLANNKVYFRVYNIASLASVKYQDSYTRHAFAIQKGPSPNLQ